MAILKEETHKRFGYYPKDLKSHSGKKILAACDGCGTIRAIPKRRYRSLCKSCVKKGKKNPRFGKHHKKETLRKMSDAHKGEKCWNWQGGISFEPYCYKFNNEFKEYIRDKFGRKCFLCGKTEEENGQRLSVHHCNYDKNCGCADIEEKRKADDNTCQFVSLCASCHSKVHHDRDKWEQYFKNKLRNKLNGWYI